MVNVSKERFYEFLNSLDFPLHKVQGETFHSHYYADEKGKTWAYMETSSYGAKTKYRIESDEDSEHNEETMDFLKDKFN